MWNYHWLRYLGDVDNMNMKEANLKAEIKEDENGVVVILNVDRKLSKGEPKKYIEVIITPDNLEAKLNKLNCFTMVDFNLNKMHVEIAN